VVGVQTASVKASDEVGSPWTHEPTMKGRVLARFGETLRTDLLRAQRSGEVGLWPVDLGTFDSLGPLTLRRTIVSFTRLVTE
jgi:hypothetical protein